jgi:phenylacetate-CoA ligase
MGFPSSLYAVARHVLESREERFQLRTVITSGEVLYPDHRKVIEEAFGCRVFDQYGCTENCVFAAECAEGSMHLSPDYGIVEVVDAQGAPMPLGETGELVCTGLINDAQILLRYRVGDMGALAAESCPCGSSLPLLKSLVGRTDDVFIASDGRYIGHISTDALLSGVSTVVQWQIVQEDMGHFLVRVVAGAGFGERDADRIKRNLAKDVGPGEIEVVQVDSIGPTRGGKSKLLVCNIPASRRPTLGGADRGNSQR